MLANNHRYKPEPLFSRTGVGSLSSASTEERAQEEARSTALIERLKTGAAASGKKSGGEVLTLGETWNSCGSAIARAPFLFFNGNTFADVARQSSLHSSLELPATRRREGHASAVAHYIAGVLAHESMAQSRE